MNHDPKEERTLQLLSDFRDELANAVDTLGGRAARGFHDNYTFHAAVWVGTVTEAFILLRREGRLDASKLLVRPVMETTFRAHAVRAHPELLFRIAFTERLRDRTWFQSASVRAGEPFDDRADEERWNEFKREYGSQSPAHSLHERRISTLDIARKAGLGPYYESHYRMYCNFEHAALRAIGGSLNDLSDPEDSRTMAMCVFTTLACLESIGAEAPNLEALHDRLERVDEPFPS